VARAALEKLGCPVVNIIEGPGIGGVGREPAGAGCPDAPDLRPLRRAAPDPLDEWITEPFRRRADGKLYARGPPTTRPVFCLLKPTRLCWTPREAAAERSLHLRGEEECAARSSSSSSGTSRSAPGRCGAGVRHVYYARLAGCIPHFGSLLCRDSVRTLERDLHSGTYGGVAPNAIETLVRILLSSSQQRKSGSRRYEAVKPPTKAELDTWNKLPFDREDFLRSEVTARS